MYRKFYLSVVLVACIIVYSCKQKRHDKPLDSTAIKQKIVKKDTLKVQSLYTGMPRPILFIDSYNSYPADWENMPGIFNYKILQLKIYMDTRPNGNPKYRKNSGWIVDQEDLPYYKEVYVTKASDSLMTDHPLVITVKYFRDYYLVFFPKFPEWGDFIPLEDNKGYLSPAPIAFLVDTVNVKLVKLKSNSSLAVRKDPKYRNITIYGCVYGCLVFKRPFAFSKKSKEFMFGRRIIITE
jgi:hypothetical protein